MVRTTLVLVSLVVGCANSDFAGTAGQRSAIDQDGADAGDSGDAERGHAGDTSRSDGGDAGDDHADDGGVGGDGDHDDSDLGDDNDSAGGDDDLMTDEQLASLPGVEVVKVGVNFEDSGLQGDRDHNDAVLCFDGRFKVDYARGDVVSLKKQVVVGRTYSSAACTLSVRVEVVHADGSKETPISFAANSGQEVSMNFKKGSKLEVYMTSLSGCHQGVEKNMHNNVDSMVEPDVCRR